MFLRVAKQTTMRLVDDLDGSDADTTIGFTTLDGGEYTIDLSSKNADKMRALLYPYVAAGRRLGRAPANPAAPSPRRPSTSTPTDRSAIRAWAAENGYTVAAMGRISGDVIAAYREAH